MANIEVTQQEASYIREVLAQKIQLEEQELEATKALAEKIDLAFSEQEESKPQVDEPVSPETPVIEPEVVA